MSLAELLQQKAELDRQIALAQRERRDQALGQIRSLMEIHGLTPADFLSGSAGRARKDSRTRRSVAPKYKDSQGHSWSGRGLKPKWLTAALAAGSSLADFAI